MKRLMLSAILIVASSVFVLSQKQNKTTSSLVGTWKLIAWQNRFPDGEIKYPFGRNPRGLLIYQPNGYMAIQVMKTPHPKVASNDETKITAEEKISLFDSYVAYFGTYTVDWQKQIVTHKVEGDLSDTYLGTTQERPFELQGDSLTISPRYTEDGKIVQGLRVFERVK
ncbi:MAG: lipocalin-like domain-containing protein [Pyrinomonadaceae bacterium]